MQTALLPALPPLAIRAHRDPLRLSAAYSTRKLVTTNFTGTVALAPWP